MSGPLNIRHMAYIAEPFEDFRKGIDAARTVAALQEVTEAFASLFPDANTVAQSMDDEAFLQWRVGLRKERKKQFAGDDFAERFGALLMPEIALHVHIISTRLHVPFGLAFNRLVEVGKIKITRKGIAEAEQPPSRDGVGNG